MHRQLGAIKKLDDGWLGDDSKKISEKLLVLAEKVVEAMPEDEPYFDYLPIWNPVFDGGLMLDWGANYADHTIELKPDGTMEYECYAVEDGKDVSKTFKRTTLTSFMKIFNDSLK